MLAKAKTGTGKTMAFLVPAIEIALIWYPVPRGQVGVLCVSPTRELAQQTADEAKALLTYHGSEHECLCVVGNILHSATLPFGQTINY